MHPLAHLPTCAHKYVHTYTCSLHICIHIVLNTHTHAHTRVRARMCRCCLAVCSDGIAANGKGSKDLSFVPFAISSVHQTPPALNLLVIILHCAQMQQHIVAMSLTPGTISGGVIAMLLWFTSYQSGGIPFLEGSHVTRTTVLPGG